MPMPIPEMPGLLIEDLPNGAYRVTRDPDAPPEAWAQFFRSVLMAPDKEQDSQDDDR